MNTRRRWPWLLLALGMAYAFQILFFPDNPNSTFYQHVLDLAPWLADARRTMILGGLGFLGAMLLFAWSAPPLPNASTNISSPNPTLPRLEWVWLPWVGTIGLWAWSLLRFAQQGEDAFTRWLWVGSIAMLVGGALLLAWIECGHASPTPNLNPWRWRHLTVIAAILGGAIWLRFHLLADIPQDLHGDMASMGLQAREILAGTAPGIFHQGWADIPMLGFYPSVIGLKFISNSILGLNAMPAVEGVLTILGLYLLTWRLFDSYRLAALAAAALTVNTPHIHFSRLAAYMDPWPWSLFGFLLAAHGLRGRRLWPFPLAGLLFGISLQMYYSGRAILIILPLTALFLAWLYRDRLKATWTFWLSGSLLLGLGGLVALGPSLLYFLQNTGPLLERSRSVFLFHEPVMTHLMGKYHVQSPLAVLLEQTRRSLLMFQAEHDTSTQFGYTHPMFTPFLAPLIPLGFAYSLRRWRHFGLGFALIWLLTILITGSILTNNAPFWPRLVGILPVAALMAGLTLHITLRALGLDRPILSLLTPSPTVTIMLLLTLGFLHLGQTNWKAYFNFTSNNARPQARIGRYLDALPKTIHACSFSTPYRLNVRETAFLAWPRQTLDLAPDTPSPLLIQCPGPERVWILSAQDATQLKRVQTRWPRGELRILPDAARREVVRTYWVHGLPNAQAATPVSSAYLPDGNPFLPQFVYQGNTSSHVDTWRIGPVQVHQGQITLVMGPMPGQDAVVDYVEFLAADGTRHRFEAENLSYQGQITFAHGPGQDNRWWLQSFAAFSNGAGLVAQKYELVPALVTTIHLPDGLYDLRVGTFTGDPANGIFALGLSVQSDDETTQLSR